MRHVLARWNLLSDAEAVDAILPCCGSVAWARGIVARRPLPDEMTLIAASDEIWRNLAEPDWLEAFRSHPRIGESRAPAIVTHQSTIWSEREQRRVAEASESAKVALVEANLEYERRFKRIFIVCAASKSPEEILVILHRRLQNDDATELREAAEQQREITRLRLKKWLQE
jgi:2-oxo-4-hydroxy-4-carboxy-5-ureidoimidazoline decarboxylase